MPGPAGQHTLILQQDSGYEKGNGGGYNAEACPFEDASFRQFYSRVAYDAVGFGNA
jgi:hypothetical protein